MLVELVRTTTADGHRLDGALATGASLVSSPNACDVVLFLHGVGGNFYAGNLFDVLAKAFQDRGVATLRVNTRGHDSASVLWTSGGPVQQGAAYEIVDQSRLDVAQWLAFLKQRGYSRVGILGHSLGAIKAIYSQALEPADVVQWVVACSAPRLCYTAFMNGDQQPRFFESYSEARRLVGAGQGSTLFQAKFPFPILITAAGYIDKYGPEEKYDILKCVGQVRAPLLATYGQLEVESGGVAFAGMPDNVRSRRRPDQDLEAITIPGADHAYTGVANRLAEAVLGWLASRT